MTGTLTGTIALTDIRTHLVCKALENKLATEGHAGQASVAGLSRHRLLPKSNQTVSLE